MLQIIRFAPVGFARSVDGLQVGVYVRAVPQPLPRSYRRQEQERDAAKVARIVAYVEATEPPRAERATAAGDSRRLRGMPTVGRGTSGAIPGTNPVGALLARESRG